MMMIFLAFMILSNLYVANWHQLKADWFI